MTFQPYFFPHPNYLHFQPQLLDEVIYKLLYITIDHICPSPPLSLIVPSPLDNFSTHVSPHHIYSRSIVTFSYLMLTHNLPSLGLVTHKPSTRGFLKSTLPLTHEASGYVSLLNWVFKSHNFTHSTLNIIAFFFRIHLKACHETVSNMHIHPT